MSKKLSSSLAFMAALLLTFSLAQASDIDTRGESENLKKRLEQVEGADETEGEETLFSILDGNRSLAFHGEIVVQAAYEKTDNLDSTSDLLVDSALLGIDINLSKEVGGHIVLLYEEAASLGDEEGEGPEFGIDEANISLHTGELLGGNTGIVLGKAYIPFGHFNSSMLTDPLTLDLGETNKTFAMISWESRLVEVKAGTFSGDVDKTGARNTIDSVFASLVARPMSGVELGASVISDLTETDSGLLAEGQDYDYRASVPGAAAFISVELAGISLDLEYVTAVDDFKDDMIKVSEAVGASEDDLSGKKPRATNLEVAFSPMERTSLALRYEMARDYQDDIDRYGVTVSYGIFDDTELGLEYLVETPDKGSDDTQSITAQMAFEF